jgi:CMP-N-acetylneuraminic acid synthetase
MAHPPPIIHPDHRPALAVVLARAGSKGVPGKNVAIIGGRPCVAWTIEAAQQARTVARVIVSTDDSKVKAVATDMGAEIVDRPAALAGDFVSVDDAVRHAVVEADRSAAVSDGPRLDPVVILYACVPVRPQGLIDQAVHVLLRVEADSVQSYSRVGKNHPWWTCRLDENTGAVKPWEGQRLFNGVFRRQDLPTAFVPDGGVMVVTRPALMRELGVPDGPHAFLGREGRRYPIVNPEGSVVDIDSRVDLLVADALLRERTPACGGAEAKMAQEVAGR